LENFSNSQRKTKGFAFFVWGTLLIEEMIAVRFQSRSRYGAQMFEAP
jgi:hypothetical protein